MKEKNSQKGFIRISLFIIITVTITTATVATGAILYKQGKLDLFTADISESFQKNGEHVNPEETGPVEVKEFDLIEISLDEEVIKPGEASLKEKNSEKKVEEITKLVPTKTDPCTDINCSDYQHCDSGHCINNCKGTNINCGSIVPCANCNNKDGCVGDDYYDYYCEGTSCLHHSSSDDSRCVSCTRHDSYSCDDDDVYWYNSCNEKEGIKKRCTVYQYCSGGECYDNCQGTDNSCGFSSCTNCNDKDGWVDSIGFSPLRCDGNKSCTHQKQEYRDYSCSNFSCRYSVTDTKTNKSCTECGPSKTCLAGYCLHTFVKYETPKYKAPKSNQGISPCEGLDMKYFDWKNPSCKDDSQWQEKYKCQQYLEKLNKEDLEDNPQLKKEYERVKDTYRYVPIILPNDFGQIHSF